MRIVCETAEPGPRFVVEDSAYQELGELKGQIVAADGTVRPLSFDQLHELFSVTTEAEVVHSAGCRSGQFGFDLAHAIIGLARKHRISLDAADKFAAELLGKFTRQAAAAGK